MRGKRFARGVVLLYLFVGCGPEDCTYSYSSFGPSQSSSQGCGATAGSGCQVGGAPNGSLGQGDFAYVCPSAAGADADPWCVMTGLLTSAEPPDASDAQASDDAAVMDLEALEATDGGPAIVLGLGPAIPDVAVGAGFQLSYTPVSATRGLGAPTPVLDAVVETAPGGTALGANEWAGYVVEQGAAVFDYTHVHGRPIASIRLWLAPQPAASGVPVGTTMTVTALPLSVDGTLLAGAIGCSFSSSDPSVATVTGSGASAVVTTVGSGRVTLGATCLGATGHADLGVGSSDDAGVEDSGTDAGTDAGAGDGETGPGDDGSAVDGGPGDAPGDAGGEGD